MYPAWLLLSVTAALGIGPDVACAIGEQLALEKVPPTPRLCIQEGCLFGRDLDGLEGGKYEAFTGIPYAKPPVGELRFKNPVPSEPWTGDYDATWERSRCIQKNDLRPQAVVEGSEDCLYLNVFRPKNFRGPLPVIFFIHGGGYATGSISLGEYGPERLMDTSKVILVMVQYRLAVFGFLATGDEASPGNYAMKDQVMALKWVQRNIAQFGGDPTRVTIMGQSAGGASVQLHLMSPLSKGLFSKAVSMSGSTLGFWNYNHDPLTLARRQAAAVGVEGAQEISTAELVESLRKVDALTLASSIDSVKFFYIHHITTYTPVVEKFVTGESFMTEDPRDLWSTGRYHQVPYVMGFVPNEGVFTADIIANKTQLEELNANSRSLIPHFVGVDTNPLSVQMLKDSFFPDGTNDQWLTDDNLYELQEMLSEGYISYAIVLSIKQYLHYQTTTPKAPLSLYYFNFKGRYSRSHYYTQTYADFGVCHADDLNFLFRPSAIIPDYGPETPSWYMAKALVDYFVQFATNGITEPLCTTESCPILQFTNSDDPRYPVRTNYLEGFNEERFAFWYNLYAMQNY
ncbi:hypothetical protein RP20_CCG027140 [Aedes albopictus]|nr:hypothetical protein RP20_CCG027140 [Aedes albopictus]